MEVELDGRNIKVFITRKNNKNMYLRVKPDGIHISCNYFVTKGMILSFITNNESAIIESYDRLQKKEKKKEEFYYLGNKYDVVILNTINERVKVCYNLFEEDIPYPKLVIGKMTRKWGYCNKRQELVKLNFDLIKYSIDEIDYVIIHELCHLLEFNHSKRFWSFVKKYKPDYKKNQSVVKEE